MHYVAGEHSHKIAFRVAECKDRETYPHQNAPVEEFLELGQTNQA